MDFFLLIDKPSGLTSFEVISKLRKILRIKKIGHSGTLDLMATGLLLIAVGSQATKMLEFLIGLDKGYAAKMITGVRSDTYDISGNLVKIENEKLKIENKETEKVLKGFEGEIMQRPPVYSALKIDGKRASDRVRAGEEVEIKERKVNIYKIENVECGMENREYTFIVHCSSGTYIRSLINDVGDKLGCGAVMSDLRRTKIGDFDISDALTIDEAKNLSESEVLDKKVISLEEIAIKLFDKFDLNDIEFEDVRHGNIIKDRSNSNKDLIAAFYKGKFVSILKRDMGNCCVYKNFV